MKKSLVNRLLSAVIILVIAGSGINVVYGENDMMQIGTAADLVKYRETINSGIQKDAILVDDIDLGELETGWIPIGNTDNTEFSACFDGNGHKISGLNSQDSSWEVYGLFGYTGADSVIKNVTVEGTAKGKKTGGIVGISNGQIKNCTSIVCVNSESYAGGIAAASYGIIDSCANFGEVSSKTDYSGGITGYTVTEVNNSKNYGFVSGISRIGGIAGWGASMSNNINYGDITSTGEYCGGIVGIIKASDAAPYITVSNCANKGEINAGKTAGGVIGSIYYGIADITKCVNDGKVTGSAQWIGGVMGATSNWGYTGTYTINQCINRAPVHSVGNYSGGIVGNMLVGDIINSYNTAAVTSVLTPGGIVGYANPNSTTIKNTFNYSDNSLCFSNAKCENVYALQSKITDQKKTAEQFRNGTVFDLINGDDVWVQGTDYPINKEIETINGVKTYDELKNAISDPNVKNIEIAANIAIDETITVDKSVVISGNGYKLNGNDTIFNLKSADIVLKNIALGGERVLINADSSNINIEGNVRMYNLTDVALMLNDTGVSIDENAVFFTMPGCAVSSNVELTFNIKNTQTEVDGRYMYTFNNAGTMYSKISNIVLKAEDNEGLSYDVYGFVKSGNLYIMVPACVDLSNCVYTEVGSNGFSYNKVTANFNSDEKYQVKIGVVLYDVVAMQSQLPTLYIDINEEYGTIDSMNSSEDHSVCTYGDLTVDVPQDLVDKYGWLPQYKSSESNADTPGTAEIRGRGNSTWSTSEFRKKPYQIKTEKKIDLLGMGKAKTWCIIKDGGYFVGQKLGLDLGLGLGLSCTPDSRFVEVYMNGEYLGCYTLTEKVQIKENRVEITDLEDIVDKNGITADTDLSGGYLMEIDNYGGDSIVIRTNGNDITIKSPENLDKEARKDNNYSYIYNYIDDLFNAIYGDGLMSNGKSYLDYIDIESFVRYYWHQEFIENMDCGIGSTYMYKDTDAINPKLIAGPVWDNDNIFKSEDNIEKWYVKNLTRYGGSKTLYNQLMCRKDFVSYAIWYYEHSNIREKLASAIDIVKEYQDTIGIADDMDFIRWGVNTFNNGDKLLSYLNRRLTWIDENYKSLMEEASIGKEIDVDSILGSNPDPNPIINDGTYASFRFSNGQSGKVLDKSYGNYDTGYYATHGSIESARLKVFMDVDTKAELKWSAPEYMYNGNASVVPVLQASGENTWKNQEENPAYIQIELPMNGYTDGAFSAKLAASKKGPKNYKLMYSVNGNDYKELGRYSLTSNKKFEQAFDNVALPNECNNAETVYIRITVADNETVGGSNLTAAPASGEFAIQDIVIAKHEIPADYSISAVKLFDISGNEINSIQDKTSFDIRVDLKKTIDKNESAALITAVYDENDTNIETRIMDISSKSSYSASIWLRFNQTDNVSKKMKIFLWQSANDLIPLCQNKDIKLQ